MEKLYYHPEGAWLGDCMPFYHNGAFYLFHQRSNRIPEPLGEPFGWDLSVTKDFVHYEDMGEAIPKGAIDSQEQYLFAGSVFKGRDGRFHAVYTGHNGSFYEQGKSNQVLMLAHSGDLLHWEKEEGFLLPPQPGYDSRDWRDPFVLWNDEKQEYLLILGAHQLEGRKARTGCTVYFTSKDLKGWSFRGDFWAPHLFQMHEKPELFKMGDWWYHIVTECSERGKTFYRMSRSLNGPWSAPRDDGFDGRAYCAARTCSDGEHRYLFGWVPTKMNNDDMGPYQWGGSLAVHEIIQQEDGSLQVTIPQSVFSAFQKAEPLPSLRLETVDSLGEQAVIGSAGKFFLFEGDVSFSEGTRGFGIRLCEELQTGDAYRYEIRLSENLLDFGRTPNYPCFRYLNKGLDRPVFLEPGKAYRLRLLVDDTIATLYLGGVALNARIYDKPGEAISFYVLDGALTVDHMVYKALG